MRRLVEIGPRNFREVDSTVESVLADIAKPAPAAWPAGWETWTEVVEAHRQRFDEYAQQAVTYAMPLWCNSPDPGRGIVMPAGGPVYFQAAYVAISVLRAIDCKLPVEVWHLGPRELDPQMRGLLEQLGDVRCRDALQLPQPRMLTGWGLKPFAVLHSDFREVLLLDADQLPARDPTYLFDAPEYRDKGAALWPDLRNPTGYSCTSEFFHVMGLPEPHWGNIPGHDKPTGWQPLESGQAIFDSSRRLAEVWLWSQLCAHADFLWPTGRRAACYGDKDTLGAAFLMLASKRGEQWVYSGDPPFGLPFALIPTVPKFIGSNTGGAGAFLQHDADGQHVFTHRVQPFGRKWADRTRLGVPNEGDALDALARLDKLWSGKLWSFGDPENIGGAVGDWLLFRGGEMAGRVTLAPGSAAKGVAAWAQYRDNGEPRLALTDGTQTEFLGPDADGCWQNQNTAVVLHPAPPAWFTVRDAFDAVVWHSINGPKNEYRLPDRFEPGDVVLDIGAHAGAFAAACLERGAGKAICVEPNPENVAVLRKHMARYSYRAEIFPVAATGRSSGPRSLHFPGGAEHSGGGMTVINTHGTCWSVSLADIVRRCPTPIRLLKLDCEGAEWDILTDPAPLVDVLEIVGEYHCARTQRTADDLRLLLTAAGFSVEIVPNPGAEGLGNFYARRADGTVCPVCLQAVCVCPVANHGRPCTITRRKREGGIPP